MDMESFLLLGTGFSGDFISPVTGAASSTKKEIPGAVLGKPKKRNSRELVSRREKIVKTIVSFPPIFKETYPSFSNSLFRRLYSHSNQCCFCKKEIPGAVFRKPQKRNSRTLVSRWANFTEKQDLCTECQP
ncbi:hypothetical protein CDAR_33171 [Caerostris darwini]|uniref:Uncharacterized protein n=1 Tax=Caerostris darwini TaxID=1538125 RepID=A0AAV4X2V0_9ARAC|nr:hypothetical protein CDAR_33171 [Caerostris darwini]